RKVVKSGGRAERTATALICGAEGPGIRARRAEAGPCVDREIPAYPLKRARRITRGARDGGAGAGPAGWWGAQEGGDAEEGGDGRTRPSRGGDDGRGSDEHPAVDVKVHTAARSRAGTAGGSGGGRYGVAAPA